MTFEYYFDATHLNEKPIVIVGVVYEAPAITMCWTILTAEVMSPFISLNE